MRRVNKIICMLLLVLLMMTTPKVDASTKSCVSGNTGTEKDTDIVCIPDDIFRKKLNEILGQGETADITVGQMKTIDAIDNDTDGAGISSIEGVEYAINAMSYNFSSELSHGVPVSFNNITDVTPLCKAVNGRVADDPMDFKDGLWIALSDNKISDVSCFHDVNMRAFYADGNNISDISFFKNNIIADKSIYFGDPGNLEIFLNDNHITDFSPLNSIVGTLKSISNGNFKNQTFNLPDLDFICKTGEINCKYDMNDYHNITTIKGEEVDVDEQILKPGSNTMSYDYYDKDDGTSSASFGGYEISLKLKQNVIMYWGPNINGNDEIEVSKGNSLSDKQLKMGFNITSEDEEDGDLTSKVIVDSSNVDFDTVGEYKISFYTKDSDGYDYTKEGKVKIINGSTNNEPSIIGDSEKVIKDISSMNDEELKSLFNIEANDIEDGDITNKVVVDQNKVDYTKEGIYSVTFKVEDSDGNRVNKIVRLNVKISDKNTKLPTDNDNNDNSKGDSEILQTGTVLNVAMIPTMFSVLMFFLIKSIYE